MRRWLNISSHGMHRADFSAQAIEIFLSDWARRFIIEHMFGRRTILAITPVVNTQTEAAKLSREADCP
jgi:hypothetical protein